MTQTELDKMKRRDQLIRLFYDVAQGHKLGIDAVEEVESLLDEGDKQREIEQRHEGYMEEIRHLRETYPARGNPMVRIEKDGVWYVVQITKAIDSPDGILIEGRL